MADKTMNSGGNGFSAESGILPGDLQEAENTLVQLASVFFAADPMCRVASFVMSEFQDMTGAEVGNG